MVNFSFQVSDEDQDNSGKHSPVNESNDKDPEFASTKKTLNDSSLPNVAATNNSEDKVHDSKIHEDQLEMLRQKSEEASKTIELLKMQLQQQSDYELLKREIQ